MLKPICDLCGREIQRDSFGGGVMRIIEKFPIQRFEGIVLQKGVTVNPPTIIEKEIQNEVWDLCEPCQKWIWSLIDSERKRILTERTFFTTVVSLVKSSD